MYAGIFEGGFHPVMLRGMTTGAARAGGSGGSQSRANGTHSRAATGEPQEKQQSSARLPRQIVIAGRQGGWQREGSPAAAVVQRPVGWLQ